MAANEDFRTFHLKTRTTSSSENSQDRHPSREWHAIMKFCFIIGVLAVIPNAFSTLSSDLVCAKLSDVVASRRWTTLFGILLDKLWGLLLDIFWSSAVALGILITFGIFVLHIDKNLIEPGTRPPAVRKHLGRGCMPTVQTLGILRSHGCPDVTKRVQERSIGWIPIFSGCFSDIHEGLIDPDERKVAIKCPRVLLSFDSTREALKEVSRELGVWSKLRHANIVELHGLIQFHGRVGMVLPWMKNGNIIQYTAARPSTNRLHLCAQVARGLTYLHSQGVVHGDLKGTNVLIADDGVAKITDFGNTVIQTALLHFGDTTSISNSSVRWAAPETLMGSPCNDKSDVYALAMVRVFVITIIYTY
ncbi:hypothetical protein FRC08_017407 [Ceratobasidium sp. 394]|nr:hypothetical protein FRC08_017407 [Ceratobasidium sp. 394]